MKKYELIGLLLLFGIFFNSCKSKNNNLHTIEWDSIKSIVFIGNSFAENFQHYNYFETLLQASFHRNKIQVKNLGWSGDELNDRSRPYNFPSQDSLIEKYNPDLIICSYGMNEAFKGIDSLERFKYNLKRFITHIKANDYNDRRVVLLSPIELQDKSEYSREYNATLLKYVSTMDEVCQEEDVVFVNLYHIFKKSRVKNAEITSDGFHLNEEGYKIISEYLAQQFKFPISKWENCNALNDLKRIIAYKNDIFYKYYRAVNWEYIAGRRKEPWVQPKGGPISFPNERRKMERMIMQLDSLIWKQGNADDRKNLMTAHSIIDDSIQYYKPLNRLKDEVPSSDQFILPEGFEIELFASEKDFSLQNPVKMTFDPDGRLWVSVMPGYPQYFPGTPPNDKILILEDSNLDGKADKETVFADSLYMPLSFEFGKGGVYVSEPPNMYFYEDKDGDGKADKKSVVFQGFGTEDVHHTLSTYTWGMDGALYWNSGTFLHSKVETKYGVKKGDYGITWRYEPLTGKLDTYISYPYANPWGHVFTRDGTEIISDVSTGMNYFAPPLTVKTSYPKKLTAMKDFLIADSKPKVCGIEIVSSRNFPEDMQGDLLLNMFLGETGIRQFKVNEESSGIVGKKKERLLKSKNPYFRPVDLEFGPDGALYVLDWYNPIIQHGERALRDTLRDHTHGRIWRITYKKHPLNKPLKLSKLSVYDLLEQLKTSEDRVRYRVRTQLRQLDSIDVLPVLKEWVENLDSHDDNYNKLEALWVYQQFDTPNEPLLHDLLTCSDDKIRTAATRVMLYWKDRVSNAEDNFLDLLKDTSPKVRLQAMVSLSHYGNEKSLNAFLSLLDTPMDYYEDYVLKQSLRQLKPLWWGKLLSDSSFLDKDSDKVVFLINLLMDEDELKMPGFFYPDPNMDMYSWSPLKNSNLDSIKNQKLREYVVSRLANTNEMKLTTLEKGQKFITNSDCLACHNMDNKVVGPSFIDISKRYDEEAKTVEMLVNKVIEGGNGNWGEATMTPHPGEKRENIKASIEYILSLK